MKCTQAQKMIGPYLEHALQEKEMAAFLDHVESCPDCREELEMYLAIFGCAEGDLECSGCEGDNIPLRLKRLIASDRKRLHSSHIQNILLSVLLAGTVLVMIALFYISIFGTDSLRSGRRRTASEAVSESATETVSEKGTEKISESAERSEAAAAERSGAAAETGLPEAAEKTAPGEKEIAGAETQTAGSGAGEQGTAEKPAGPAGEEPGQDGEKKQDGERNE